MEHKVNKQSKKDIKVSTNDTKKHNVVIFKKATSEELEKKRCSAYSYIM